MRKWLNEIDSESDQDGIFYNSLSRIDLLLDGRFCLDKPTNVTEEEFVIENETRKKVTNFTPINNCTNIATDKVGLITFEDYVYSLDGIDKVEGALGRNYIDEDELLWTMTKYTLDGSTDRVWHTHYTGPSHIEHGWNTTHNQGKGVRPVIYMSAQVKIEESNESNYGTINNPYRLLGEQKLKNGDDLNGVTIGSYIYLSEENNPYDSSIEYVHTRITYNYDKTKVRYRVVGINKDGSIKVERADVLRDLPDTISIRNGISIPYYHYDNGPTSSSCLYLDGTWYVTGCNNHNCFKPEEGSGEFNYDESENIGFFLNQATNSFYNWFSDSVKNNILTTVWNLAVAAYDRDYTETLFNNDYSGTYPTRTNDGIVSAKIGLPQWGDMFTGNDLNYGYWFLNRWFNGTTTVTIVGQSGYGLGTYTANIGIGVRPVFNLSPNIKITGGEGTPANPYTLSI